jgi:activator of HSP90 ATPase
MQERRWKQHLEVLMSQLEMNGAAKQTSTRREMLAGVTLGVGGFAVCPFEAVAKAAEEVSHSSEEIHQEILFKATRKRVYEALTETKQFNSVVLLSAAMKDGPPPNAAPTEISREVGGTFTLFGGHIVGRHLELVPQKRIVQAWRVVDWEPGAFSIAKFQLAELGSGTTLILAHSSFPKGLGEHLAEGWRLNYWEPLQRFLAGAAA